MAKKTKKLMKKGKRLDGRKPDEMRPIKIKAGYVKRADGSAYIEWGGNKVVASVHGPRTCYPRHERSPYKARIQFKYKLAPFSVDDRANPAPSRRDKEISKVSSEALEKAVFTEYYPKTTIDIYATVIEAAAGTRVAALSAASVALADAGIPMRDLVPACATGKIEDTVVLDLNKDEDQEGQADLPVAYLPHSDEITLMQMDGDLTPEEYEEALDLAVDGCMKVYEEQKRALRERYEHIEQEKEEE